MRLHTSRIVHHCKNAGLTPPQKHRTMKVFASRCVPVSTALRRGVHPFPTALGAPVRSQHTTDDRQRGSSTRAASTESSTAPPRRDAKSTWALPVVLGLSIPVAISVASNAAGLTPYSWYLSLLEVNPFGTKLITGVAGAFIGDLVAQALPVVTSYLAGPKAQPGAPIRYDVARAGRFVLFSAVIATPVTATWFKMLDLNIMPDNPTSMAAVATKVALDQLCLAPLMTSGFFTFVTLLQGQPLSMVPTILSNKLVPTMKANYMLWPLAHTINFAFVPTDERILFVNCVAVIWTAILSTMAAKK